MTPQSSKTPDYPSAEPSLQCERQILIQELTNSEWDWAIPKNSGRPAGLDATSKLLWARHYARAAIPDVSSLWLLTA